MRRDEDRRPLRVPPARPSRRLAAGSVPGVVMAVVALAFTCGALASEIAQSPRAPGGRAPDGLSLVISEMMYHPSAGGAEFIEVTNSGVWEVDLGGVHFSAGIDFVFPPGSMLAPGAIIVLTSSVEDFGARYPRVDLFGEYAGRLSNRGETVILSDALGRFVVAVAYRDALPWPTEADGDGYSLVLVDPAADPGVAASWRASTGLGGSPGEVDPRPDQPRAVVNEALTHAPSPLETSIEIFNPTGDVVDITGWFLSDDRGKPRKARIPDDDVYSLAPGGYAVVDGTVFNAEPGRWGGEDLPGFALRPHEEGGIYLFAAGAAGALSGFSHGVEYGAAAPGVSFGRFRTVDGRWHFVAQEEATLGAENAGPKAGPLVISEINYHPLSGGVEYVALTNISAGEVDLWVDGPDGGGAGWRILGIDFEFAPHAVAPAHGTILAVDEDPERFRASHRVPEATAVHGPFGSSSGDGEGSLRDGGEAVVLVRPGEIDGSVYSQIVVDRVRYDDRAPWPDAHGNGLVLKRWDLWQFGDDPHNWYVTVPCFEPQGCPGPIDPTATLFDPDVVLDVEIEIAPVDWEVLRAQERSLFNLLGGDCLAEPFVSPFTYFPATVSVNGIIVEEAGVRKKGFLGSLSRVKPSLKIKLDEYVDGQRLSGLSLMTLNNAQQDPAYVDQCIGYGLFAVAGVPAPRCSFARVRVNGLDLGLYVHVESVKERFLARHFESADGNLYEGTLSDFRPGWVNTFERKTNRSDASRTDLEAMVEAMTVDDDDLVAALGTLVDLDAFMDFWVIEVLVGHWDGYTSNTNNFFVYKEPVSGLFHFIPWGADALLDDPALAEEDGITSPVFATAILARRLYLHPATRQMYSDRVHRLLDEIWHEPIIVAEIDRMESLLAPHLGAEALPLFSEAIEQARSFVRSRRERILATLDPDPPPLTEPLRDPPCFEEIGELAADFSTWWGSFDTADPFVAGSGSLEIALDGEPVPVVRVGAVAGAGADPEAGEEVVVAVVGSLTDGSLAIALVATHPSLVLPGASIAIDWTDTIGYLLHLVPGEGSEPTLVGLLSGSMSLGEADTTAGGEVTGTIDAAVLGTPF